VARHTAPYRVLRQRLRRARIDRGLSQAAAARELGKPQSYISKCESGERRVDVIELVDLARLYGVPLTYFVSDKR